MVGEIGSPIKDFVHSLFTELEEGLQGCGFIMCPEKESFGKMELNTIAVNTSKGEGGAKILGIGASVEGTDSNTDSQKITVFYKKIRKSDLEKENAEIEKAKAEVEIAKQKQIYSEAIALKGFE
jgi:hypothetical protein